MDVQLDMPEIAEVMQDWLLDDLGTLVTIALLSPNKDDREDCKKRLRNTYPCLCSAYTADNLILVKYRTDHVRTYWLCELRRESRANPDKVYPFVFA